MDWEVNCSSYGPWRLDALLLVKVAEPKLTKGHITARHDLEFASSCRNVLESARSERWIVRKVRLQKGYGLLLISPRPLDVDLDRCFHTDTLDFGMTVEPSNELPRKLGLFSATILVVANMVGTGIFTTPGLIMEELHSPLSMLVCWLLGGLFALSGALCYGELGAAYPAAGGEYVYLREGFGRCMGFLSGWISLLVGFSAPIAAASIAFATYACQAVSHTPGPGASVSIFDVGTIGLSKVNLLAIAAVAGISFVHCCGVTFGSRVQNLLTLLKIGIILVFVAAGLSVGDGSMANFSQGRSVLATPPDKFAVSLIFVSFAYSGWNAAGYLGGEIRRPGVYIPFALVIGTLLVTGLYMLLNLTFIYALSPDRMRNIIEVGAVSAGTLFGPGVGGYFSAAISLVLLSAISAMTMAGPRIYYAMARDGLFFRSLGEVDQSRKTPARSILLQGIIAILMIVTATFDVLLLYIGVTLSIFALATVLSLMRLRATMSLPYDAYRTVGYPVTPLVFIAGNAWIVYFTLTTRPVTFLWTSVTIGSGVLIYALFQRGKRQSATE